MTAVHSLRPDYQPSSRPSRRGCLLLETRQAVTRGSLPCVGLVQVHSMHRARCNIQTAWSPQVAGTLMFTAAVSRSMDDDGRFRPAPQHLTTKPTNEQLSPALRTRVLHHTVRTYPSTQHCDLHDVRFVRVKRSPVRCTLSAFEVCRLDKPLHNRAPMTTRPQMAQRESP